jgi:hypothetical protein
MITPINNYFIFINICMSAKEFFSGTRSKIPPGFSPLTLGASRHPWLRRLRDTPSKIFGTHFQLFYPAIWQRP